MAKLSQEQAGPLYFYEDQVCRTFKSGEKEFGMVMENWEMYSSDDDDDEQDDSRVPRGHVCVNWHPKGKGETIPESKVSLSDRSLMPGDVVRHLNNSKETQRGYCRAVKVTAAVQIVGTKKVIPNVPASNLRAVQKIQSDVAASLDSWVGVIRDVRSTLTLRLSDGSQCTIETNRLIDHFEDTRRGEEHGAFNHNEIFYPGQKLRGPMKYLKDAKWTNATDDAKRLKDRKVIIVTVIKVEPTTVTIQWQWQAPGSMSPTNYQTPPPIQFDQVANGTIQEKTNLMIQQAKQDLMTSTINQLTDYLSTFDSAIFPTRHKAPSSQAVEKNTIPNTTTNGLDNVIQHEPLSNESGKTDALENPAAVTNVQLETNKDMVEDLSEKVETQQTKQVSQPPLNDPPTIQVSPQTRPAHPPETISGEALKRLKCLNLFESCTVQLGDLSFFTPSAKDRESILEKSVWRKIVGTGFENAEISSSVPFAKSLTSFDTPDKDGSENSDTEQDQPMLTIVPPTKEGVDNLNDKGGDSGKSKKHFPRVSTRALRKKKLKKAKPNPVTNFLPDSEVVVETIYTSSIVDVVWQDGTIQEGLSSVELYPIHHLDDHEFFPGDFVIRAETLDFEHYGVIKNMNHSGRVALVQWFKVNQPFGNLCEVLKGKEPQNPVQLSLEEMSVYDIRDHPEFRFRPGTIVIYVGYAMPRQTYAGQVVDNFPDGQVRVWWTATGATTSCWPQELYRLADYDSDEGEIWDENLGETKIEDCPESDSSWETGSSSDEEERPEIPAIESAIDEVIMKFSGGTEEVVSQSESTNDTSAEIPDLIDISAVLKQSVLTPGCGEGALAISCDPYFKIECCQRFTLVESLPSNHRFASSTFQPPNPAKFLKTVQKELNLFRENLPPGIYVKGYEDRMDLYSVIILGPENTPYEDGLFLFDIHLPSSYPHLPPSVHYSSFCADRLNPNLYECGKVCVSLLGTWSGKGSEVWNSSESTLLQLLISIQGLILVAEPYYNEAGYEKQKGTQQGKENSRMYNEMVLIKLVQSMSRLIVSPPAPWVKEIREHLYKHGPRLINRCEKWLKLSEKSALMPSTANDVKEEGDDVAVGLQLGANDTGNVKLPGFSLLPVSKGFTITLKKTLDSFSKLCDPSIPSSATPFSDSSSLQQIDDLD